MGRKKGCAPITPPFAWTSEVEEEVLSRIMSGETLSKICGPDRDDFLPSERTFYRRLLNDPEFWQQYARAREAQGHREFDEILDISNAATVDDVNIARLKIDARKWRAGKLAPKVYGEKVVSEITGADGGPLDARLTIVRTIVDPKG